MRRRSRRTAAAAEPIDEGAREQAGPAAEDSVAFPELLVTEQVTALLRIGDRALNDYDRRGWLSPIPVGKRKLYRADQVLQILLNGTPNNPRKNNK
jgi:hypothetical protein